VPFHFKLLCVQLTASADNLTLLAFAAVGPALQQLINISCPLGPQQQTHHSTVWQPNDVTDRRTDIRPTVS